MPRKIGERAAVMMTLIHTAKLNDIDPQAWLADVLTRINDGLTSGLPRHRSSGVPGNCPGQIQSLHLSAP
jgi:IS66 C-terminal element